MGAIVRIGPDKIRLPGQIKPQGIPRIDWGHPLALGLISYWFDTGHGYYIDLVTGDYGSAGPSSVPPILGASPYGHGSQFTTIGSAQVCVANRSFFQQIWAHPYSIVTGFYQVATPSAFHSNQYIAIEDGPGNFGMYAMGTELSAGGQIQVFMGDESTVSTPNLAQFPLNSFNVFCAVTTGPNSQAFFNNGAQVATSASASAFNFGATDMRVALNTNFAYNAVTNVSCGAIIYFNAIWNRQLSQADSQQLYLDPYCFLIYPLLGVASMRAPLVAPLLGRPRIARRVSARGPFGPANNRVQQGSLRTAQVFLQSITVAAAGAVTMTKRAGKSLAIGCASAVSLLKSAGKSVAAASSGAVSLVKSAGKSVAIACSGAVTRSMQTGKSVAVSCAGAVSLAKNTAKQIAVAVSSSVTAAAIRVFLVTITVGCSSAVTITRQIGKNVAVGCAGAVSLVKSTAKSIAAACTSTVTRTKAAAHAVAVACAGTVASTRAIAHSVAVACASAVSSSKQTAHALALACSSAVSVLKVVGKRIAVAVSGSVAVSALRVFLVTIAVGCTSAVTMSRRTAHLVAAGCLATVTVTRLTAKAIAIAVTSLVTIVANFIAHLFARSPRMVEVGSEIRAVEVGSEIRAVELDGASRTVEPTEPGRSTTP